MENKEIIFYTTHCPKCSVLKKKLESKGIVFLETDNITELIEKGIKEAPVLKIEDNFLTFSDAIKWVNAQGAINS